MTDGHRLSDLQLAIMRVLWSRDEATVAQVHADLYEERRLAPTTIATVLSRLEKKHLVGHRADGRQFVYCAQVTEQTVRKSMVSELTDLLFAGDVTELMNHLLAAREVDTDDLARVRRLIEAKERESGGTTDDSR